ncbi:MAG TPA: hypothetical protein VG520_09465 [Candidatus Dormibacteraeota bacterium]|nr:hypothetical protein [Candidatus Dormibacteraeota bacterium]
MFSPRKLMLCAGTLLLAGCGSAASAGTPTPSPSAGAARGAFGGGATGQLVQINGTTLTLSTTNGDVTVTYASTTPITQATTGVTADIVSGSCVLIIGTKDAAGAVTASSVRLTQAVNGACATGNGGGFTGRPSGAPRPSNLPTPNPNAATVSGMVTSVVGESVTVKAANGTTTTLTVPTTVTVNESQPAAASDLVVDDCLLARGQKGTSGAIAATALTIEPATPNGTCTVVGFGGRRGGGGGAVPTPAA